MGISSQASYQNKSSLLSFYLIKPCLKWLTPLKEVLVIDTSPFDLTHDWVLRYTEWKQKDFRKKKIVKSNFLTFGLEATIKLLFTLSFWRFPVFTFQKDIFGFIYNLSPSSSFSLPASLLCSQVPSNQQCRFLHLPAPTHPRARVQ